LLFAVIFDLCQEVLGRGFAVGKSFHSCAERTEPAEAPRHQNRGVSDSSPLERCPVALLSHEGLMHYTREKGQGDKEAVVKGQKCGGLLEILWRVHYQQPSLGKCCLTVQLPLWGYVDFVTAG